MICRIDSPRLYFTGNQRLSVAEPLVVEEGLTVVEGPIGSGKTLFARILEKGWNYRTNRITASSFKRPSVLHLEFRDVHSWMGASVGYYQQRYEASMNDDVPTVGQILGDRAGRQEFLQYARRLGIDDAVAKKINYLSSGELRKLLIVNAIVDNPDLLVLDNPYIGLDAPSKQTLNEALAELRQAGQSIMLIINDDSQLPHEIDNRLYLDNMRVSAAAPEAAEETPDTLRRFPMPADPYKGELLKMEGVEVSYGDVKVLDNINWTVRSGERWSLTGPNGSGKSTLLSLVFADNPRSYSNRLWLFGLRRGSGESIWDIKRRIGFVSPEMQLHFHASASVAQIVANGLNDTVGMYVRPRPDQMEKAAGWLRHFRIDHLADRDFATLSSGERQLALIARTFIKEPSLLILDEPMHALDVNARRRVEGTIDRFLADRPDAAFIMVSHNPADLPSSITHHLHLQRHAT